MVLSEVEAHAQAFGSALRPELSVEGRLRLEEMVSKVEPQRSGSLLPS